MCLYMYIKYVFVIMCMTFYYIICLQGRKRGNWKGIYVYIVCEYTNCIVFNVTMMVIIGGELKEAVLLQKLKYVNA